jgi:malonyl CoA-acyl carrier protein transacylase
MICLFPGQGIIDERIFARQSPIHDEIFDYLENLLSLKITSENYLDHQINSPLTVAYGIANFLETSARKEISPFAVAGYSVGHFAALVASGVMDWKQCLRLVHERAKLMSGFTSETDYSMLALIGPDEALLQGAVQSLIDSESFKIAITNYNSPINHTVGGKKAYLEKLLNILPKEKVHKSVWMDKLGAWHSPALNPAIEEYKMLLNKFIFNKPHCDIFSNVSAKILKQDEIKDDLISHLVSPVRWHQIVSELRSANCKEFHEFGESGQLGKMIFFSFRDVKCKSFKELK